VSASEQQQRVGAGASEEQLLEEIHQLRRQLDEAQLTRRNDAPHSQANEAAPPHLWKPSRTTISALILVVAVLLVIAFLAGYGPMRKRSLAIMTESREQSTALPRVNVIRVARSTANNDLELPGNIQAITEAPVLARAEGYIQKRLVDIGDHVRAGQSLAEIDVPEIDEQVHQASAALDQARAAADEAVANLDQGRADLELAKLSSERWNALVGRGAVSKQENDQYQTQYRSHVAGVRSLEKAVAAQKNAVAAAEANLARLEKLRSYRIVTAPFDGVITQRNVDTGALVNAGSTLLYRIAQTDRLRIFVNVPQSYASAVRPGMSASLSVTNFPGRKFQGKIVRTSNSLDPATRTLLTEIQVDNRSGTLQPGMYADVDLSAKRATPPFLIPANALLVRSDGSQVALVQPGGTVHMQKIEVERDYGVHLDISDGLRDGDSIVLNPGDAITEGVRVSPVNVVPPPAAATK
jgi:RND family efflux transporter MFP subunit